MQKSINIQLIDITGVYDFFNDPEYRRQTVALQLVDIIVGHMNRHMGNIKVICEAGVVKRVLGVDNDITFGLKIHGHESASSTKCLGWTRVAYPRVVDSIMLEAINSLDEHAFRGQLSKRLTTDSLEAILHRWNILKTHLNSENITIIRPNEWGKPEVLKLLQQTQPDADNSSLMIPTSYVGKFMQECKKFLKIPISQIKS